MPESVQPTATYDYSVPPPPTYNTTLPTGGFQTNANPNYQASNPYGSGTKQWDVYNAYLTRLGRAPDEAGFNRYVNDSAIGNNIYDILSNSYEGQTYGRARAEVNPEIDNQIQRYYNDIQTESQKAQSQLRGIGTSYDSQLGSLDFGRQQQMDALDALRAQIGQDTDYNASQLQSRFMPAQQGAFAAANRRGLLDSSISLQLLSDAFKPIQTSLGDLYRSSQRQLSDAEQKRQTTLQKYNFDTQNLTQKREQEAQSVREALALYTAQQQQLANQTQSQRGNLINTRAGGYIDSQRAYDLQLRMQQELERYQKMQNDLALRTQAFAEQQANKK